ncbi:MAG: hypothetical protein OXG60_11080 [Chloroflexi bacterium]|nr:hypothetical protein [Chloroflexota bacterium]
MKGKDFPKTRSVFWSRLLGLLIAFAIITVMVVGGVKNLMTELSAVHEELTASQRELAVTQNKLAQTQAALENESRALQQSAQQLDAAYNKIRALHNERDQIKARWGNSLRALQQRNQQLVVTDKELREAQKELERLQQAPQVSMIVTSERQFNLSQRELFAASLTRMAVASDAGAMFYEGRQALHEKEKHVSYAERTQVIITQTLPGHDVLTCLNNPNLGCGTIVAAGVQASQMQAYSYESQYSAMETLLVDGRRGRHPGRRR